jgi:hypothetical protein
MTYATVDDVAVRLGRPITDSNEVAQVNAWLEDTEALIRARIPDLDEQVTSGALDEELVVLVECNAVIRKIKNPDGKQNEKIDDYSYGLTAEAARGDLFLTDEEWDLLTPGSGNGAWTIRPASYASQAGWWLHPDVWVPLP